MNTAIILAGGVGSRMGNIGCPKQYLMICGKPVFVYSLRALQQHKQIDAIVIVAAPSWYEFIDRWLEKEEINKFVAYAEPGETRQFSILSALERIRELCPNTQKVLIHDAARPVLSLELISACLSGLDEADGVMPVLPMKDTCYRSQDGSWVTDFIPRNELFAGQAPEAFHFLPYFRAHYQLEKQELKEISGSSELAFKCGLRILLIEGSERNIKITTKEDLLLAEQYLGGEG